MLPSSSARFALLLLFPLLLAGCSTHRESEPGRTATEQLLFSAAAERAADQLVFQLPEGSRVFVDDSYVEGTDSRYLVSTIRDRLLRRGNDIVDSKAAADVVIEPRVGAMSIDRNKVLVGTPDFGIPVPLAGPIEVPEIALFKRDTRQGVVKVGATAYNAKTGLMIQSLDPVYGFAHKKDWVLLLFLSWDTDDLVPEPERENWIGR
ncbi:MAG TPA: DUF6655 family protein [Ferrovibrio sp.]|jgi:hypothetical protein|uniref:DUF6655 family protein n=1 Tax=Ferrovibrio sp. TaxID=1917215 RepID=UPI002B4B4546|nr:DUF6655 family protein [Ferrovibrio sp.]HLT78726.1 DUF6655 family protein [Ferrovibrio sp.]